MAPPIEDQSVEMHAVAFDQGVFPIVVSPTGSPLEDPVVYPIVHPAGQVGIESRHRFHARINTPWPAAVPVTFQGPSPGDRQRSRRVAATVMALALVEWMLDPHQTLKQRLAAGGQKQTNGLRELLMKLIAKLACCFGLLVCAPTYANEMQSIDVDGVKRSYALHVPAGIGPSVPLVVVLHGKGSSGADEMARGRWQSKADKEKFIVAAPDALGSYDGVELQRPPTVREWIRRNYRALRGRNNLVRWNGGQNDVGLIASMIDRVSAEQPIDRSRIYIVGFSRGGFMAHRMALEITDRLAGVAVVSPDVEPEAKRTPARPLSFLLVSGDRDPVHPVSSDRPAATMERWRAIDHCPPLSTMKSEICGPDGGGREAVQRRHGDTLCHCP